MIGKLMVLVKSEEPSRYLNKDYVRYGHYDWLGASSARRTSLSCENYWIESQRNVAL